MKKKIVIFCTVPDTFNLILQGQPKHLAQFYEIHLVTSPNPGYEEISMREGVTVHSLKMNRGISPPKDFFSIIRAFFLIRKLRPDIIQSYTPKAGLVAMAAGFLARAPIRIHTFTGIVFTEKTGLLKKLLMLMDKLICKLATTVVPESAGVKEILLKNRITNKEINLIGYGNVAGVDVNHFYPFDSNSINICEEHIGFFRFIFIGRIHKDKGIEELVNAFQNTNQSILILLGDVDKESPPPPDIMEKIQKSDRIYWFGFQTDIRKFLAFSNALVLPSYREGFPNVLLQACAMQKPCIVSDISGCNEVIDSSIGWLVPPKSESHLHAAMQSIMQESPETLRAKGMSARRRVVDRFEKGAHLHRLVDFYSSLVNIDEKTN